MDIKRSHTEDAQNIVSSLKRNTTGGNVPNFQENITASRVASGLEMRGRVSNNSGYQVQNQIGSVKKSVPQVAKNLQINVHQQADTFNIKKEHPALRKIKSQRKDES